jgi:hypothetical protein
MAAALIGPLREIYGVSDKVLAMALSSLLLGAPKKLVLWAEVGGSMIAIDTLVHNFLHRTGILARFKANHLYGAACGPAAVPTLLQPWLSGSMPGSSIQRFRRPSPGSFSTRSGSTAPRTASMFATATGLMMAGVARARIAGSASCVIGWHCEELMTESAIDLIAVIIYGRRALQLCATTGLMRCRKTGSSFDQIIHADGHQPFAERDLWNIPQVFSRSLFRVL